MAGVAGGADWVEESSHSGPKALGRDRQGWEARTRSQQPTQGHRASLPLKVTYCTGHHIMPSMCLHVHEVKTQRRPGHSVNTGQTPRSISARWARGWASSWEWLEAQPSCNVRTRLGLGTGQGLRTLAPDCCIPTVTQTPPRRVLGCH